MQNEGIGNGFFQIIKSVALALALALLSTVIFATVLRVTALPDKVIYPINQTVKAVSLVFGVCTFVRGEKGWIKGGAAALLFTALSYLTFSAIGGDFSLSWLIIVEVLFTLAAGALGGALAVNWRRD